MRGCSRCGLKAGNVAGQGQPTLPRLTLEQMVAFIHLSALVFLASVRSAYSAGPYPGQIKNLVTFGDSYTDIVSVH